MATHRIDEDDRVVYSGPVFVEAHSTSRNGRPIVGPLKSDKINGKLRIFKTESISSKSVNSTLPL